MGLFDKIFGNRPKEPKDNNTITETFRMLDGYVPRFTNFGGSVYESDLIRSAINARAVHMSKLKVETYGAAQPALQRKLKSGPNEFQTWSQFLYRLSTILDIHNTAFIVPVYDKYGEPSGVFCPLPQKTEIKLVNVAKASLQELLEDYRDYLRTRGLKQWSDQSVEWQAMRELGKKHNDAEFFMALCPNRSAEVIANMVIVPLVLRYGYGITWEFEGVDWSLPYFAATVGLGEIISVCVLGSLLLKVLLPYKNIIFASELK